MRTRYKINCLTNVASVFSLLLFVILVSTELDFRSLIIKKPKECVCPISLQIYSCRVIAGLKIRKRIPNRWIHYIIPPTPLPFFALCSKSRQATHTWKFLTLLNFLLRIPIWKRKITQNLFSPAQSTFATSSAKIFLKKFALIKKSSYNP